MCYTDGFNDMPGETVVIQHQIKLTDDTTIRCKPCPLPYAMREELQNEVDSMLETVVVGPSTSPYTLPIVMGRRRMVLTGCALTSKVKQDDRSGPRTHDNSRGSVPKTKWQEVPAED